MPPAGERRSPLQAMPVALYPQQFLDRHMTTRKNRHKARRSGAKPVPVPGGTQRPRWLQPVLSLTGPDRGFWLSRPALVLCLGVAVSYFPALSAGFVWDDVIVTNAGPIRSPSGLWQIWFEPRALNRYEGHYWPLLYTTFWLEHKLWGFAAAGYHAVNLLLHAAVTLLLWRLLLRLGVAGAWIAAAVFAVHPLHVESVVWVIGRKDLLATLLYLACALAYIRFTEERRRGPYLLAVVLFALGLLSKSTVVTLPVALLIWHWWKQGRVTGADVARVLPFFLLGFGITFADWAYYKGNEVISFGYSLIERALIAAHALWFYAGKLVWPAELAIIYPLWEVSTGDPLAWGYFAAAAATGVLLWALRHRIGRGPFAGVLFFVVTLSPTLGFVDYGFMQFSFVADRYQYLAGAGVIATLVGAAAGGVSRLPGVRTRIVQAAVAVLLVVLGTLTWHQAGIYRNNGTYFEHILSLNPQARSAHHNLGDWYRDQGRADEALAAYRTALERRPDHAPIVNSIGVVFENQGKHQRAEEQYRRALQLDPRDTHSLNNLALLLTRHHRYNEALGLYKEVIAIDPGYMNAYTGMGVALVGLNRHREAVHFLQQALSLDPSSKEVQASLNYVRQLLQEQK